MISPPCCQVLMTFISLRAQGHGGFIEAEKSLELFEWGLNFTFKKLRGWSLKKLRGWSYFYDAALPLRKRAGLRGSGFGRRRQHEHIGLMLLKVAR